MATEVDFMEENERSAFLRKFESMSARELYADMLGNARIDCLTAGKLDFNKIDLILKYDITMAFT
tara:strand:+ start:479 stop:673 length:195 start_codon:yes stop_codon:yes gene_type:complete